MKTVFALILGGGGIGLDKLTKFVDWVSRYDTLNLHRHQVPQIAAEAISRIGPWLPEILYLGSLALVLWVMTGRSGKAQMRTDATGTEGRTATAVSHVTGGSTAEASRQRPSATERLRVLQREIEEAQAESYISILEPLKSAYGIPSSKSAPTPPQLSPHIVPMKPRVMQAHIGSHGAIVLGGDRRNLTKPFDERLNEGYVVLAPFKNEPDAKHPQIRHARALGASVEIQGISDFPVTGYWIGSDSRLVNIDIGAPEVSVALVFIGQKSAALLRDQREGSEQCIDHQTFWLGPKGTNISETTIFVKLFEGGRLLLEQGYLIRFTPPVAYLVTPSEPHT